GGGPSGVVGCIRWKMAWGWTGLVASPPRWAVSAAAKLNRSKRLEVEIQAVPPSHPFTDGGLKRSCPMRAISGTIALGVTVPPRARMLPMAYSAGLLIFARQARGEEKASERNSVRRTSRMLPPVSFQVRSNGWSALPSGLS